MAKSLPADKALDEARRMRAVLREMERLPKAERHVLLLSAVEELGTTEMAEVLGRSESAVRALLFRARSKAAGEARRRRRRVMKNSEDAMEKVLAGLRGVAAPVGMERRILNALDALGDETSVGARSGWNWL